MEPHHHHDGDETEGSFISAESRLQGLCGGSRGLWQRIQRLERLLRWAGLTLGGLPDATVRLPGPGPRFPVPGAGQPGVNGLAPGSSEAQ
jgi:hypothetical protein